jgi:PadR family transcriptional regulator, regulatory protein PadR
MYKSDGSWVLSSESIQKLNTHDSELKTSLEVLVNPDLLRGNLELILLTILEEGAMYGFEIIKEAQARTDGYFEFKEGSLYPALHRITLAGWLETQLREAGRNGQPRKYYQLTSSGRRELEAKRGEWQAFTGAMTALRRP